MNKNQRIVVSIVGITIVVVALLGLTYGYFVTKSLGNPNENSITITSNKLELTYDDQKSTINVTNIDPGQVVGTKKFTVKNTGNDTVESYAVILEGVTNTLKRKDDLLFTLTCSSGCNGVKETVFPADDTVIVTNSIDVDEIQTYELTVTYKNFDTIDQSIDMGAEFGAKVNIADTKSVNPYINGSLAYEILNKALVATSETHAATEFSYAPKTKPAQETSGSDERTLSVTPDKYGNSYYYRGNVEDNYVTFANMCWRIVRIQGDGSVKIILQDSRAACSSDTTNGETAFIATAVNYGYSSKAPAVADYVNCAHSDSKSTCLRTTLQNWFNSKFTSSSSNETGPSNAKPALKSEYTNKLKYEEWEIGDWTMKYNLDFSPYQSGRDSYYEPSVRVYNSSSTDEYASLMPSTSSTNQTVDDYVATLTSDEVAFAGARFADDRTCSYYLCNLSAYTTWLLSPGQDYSYGDKAFEVNKTTGRLGYWYVYTNYAARPAVIIASGVQVNGKGTLENPYVVSSE